MVILPYTTKVIASRAMDALQDRIKEIRGNRPQSAAAKAARISQPMWSKLERGGVSEDRSAVLRKIWAANREYSLRWVLDGTGPKYSADSSDSEGSDAIRYHLALRIEQSPPDVQALIRLALDDPDSPLPDSVRPSIKAMIEMVRLQIRQNLVAS